MKKILLSVMMLALVVPVTFMLAGCFGGARNLSDMSRAEVMEAWEESTNWMVVFTDEEGEYTTRRNGNRMSIVEREDGEVVFQMVNVFVGGNAYTYIYEDGVWTRDYEEMTQAEFDELMADQKSFLIEAINAAEEYEIDRTRFIVEVEFEVVPGFTIEGEVVLTLGNAGSIARPTVTPEAEDPAANLCC